MQGPNHAIGSAYPPVGRLRRPFGLLVQLMHHWPEGRWGFPRKGIFKFLQSEAQPNSGWKTPLEAWQETIKKGDLCQNKGHSRPPSGIKPKEKPLQLRRG